MTYTYEVITFENTKVLKRIDDQGAEAFIPMVEGNSDYQLYLKSLEDEA
jgi:hypothetical protein